MFLQSEWGPGEGESKPLSGDPRSQEQVSSSRKVLSSPLSTDSSYTRVFPISGPCQLPSLHPVLPPPCPTFPREGQTHLIYEVFPPPRLGVPQRLQCVAVPPPLLACPSPSSFCLGVWECLLFPGVSERRRTSSRWGVSLSSPTSSPRQWVG